MRSGPPAVSATGVSAATGARAEGSTAFWLYAAVAVLGLAFWFVIGFPFGNHNESYAWTVRLDRTGLWGAMTARFETVSGMRPLGTAVAWLTYHGSHGSTALTQLVNLVTTLTAWILLARAMPERRLFAWLAFLNGAVFFAGYLYLFHLHGVFYGFALLWLTAAMAECLRGLTQKSYRALAIAAWIAALFHPHVLILLLALTVGALIEFAALRTRPMLVFAAAVVVFSVVEAAALVPREAVMEVKNRMHGMLTSYRTVEVQRAVSVAAAAVTLFAASSLRGAPARILALGLSGAGLAACAALDLPLLLVWPGVCLAKAAWHGRWSLAALLAASLTFSYISPTGSPTYLVFVLLLCTALTGVDQPQRERWLARIPHAWAGILVVVSLALAFLVRGGATVPVVTRLALPLLSERERTHQLERVIAWYLVSPYRRLRVRFAQEARGPVVSATAIDRRHRPPTQVINLSIYLASRRGPEQPDGPVVVVAFGGEDVPGARRVLQIPGRWAGPAAVCLADRPPEWVP